MINTNGSRLGFYIQQEEGNPDSKRITFAVFDKDNVTHQFIAFIEIPKIGVYVRDKWKWQHTFL